MPASATLGTFGGLTTASTSNLDTNYTNINAIIANANNYANYLVDSGLVNAYVVTFGAGITLTLAAGLGVQFKAGNTSTGASTLNVSGTGLKSIVRRDGTATQAGDVQGVVTVMYDGTNYVLQSFTGAVLQEVPATFGCSCSQLVERRCGYEQHIKLFRRSKR